MTADLQFTLIVGTFVLALGTGVLDTWYHFRRLHLDFERNEVAKLQVLYELEHEENGGE